MDKKLIEALNSFADSLQQLSDAIKEQNETKEKSGGLFAGMFGGGGGKGVDKKLKAIQKGVEEIKSDNKQMLAKQDELLKLTKAIKKQKDEGNLVGGKDDKEKKNKVKDGISMLILMAAGIVAIGSAFKLVGSIDPISVMSLSVSILIVALAYEKVAESKLTIMDTLKVSLMLVIMSIALVASSYVLGYIQPVGFSQLLTAIAIAGVFVVVSFGIAAIARGVKGIKPTQVLIMPFVLITLSLAIAGSSYLLGLVKPVGTEQLLTSLAIAAVFVVISMSIAAIAKGVKGIKSPKDLLMIPLVLLALSVAIWLSSYVLSNVVPIDPSLLLNIVLQAVALTIIGIAVGFAMFVVNKLFGSDIEGMLFGGLGIVIIATAVMLSSHVLSMGDYSNPIPIPFALGIGIMSLLLMIPFVALGIAGPLVIGLGATGFLIMIGAVVAASHLLAKMNTEVFKPGGIIYLMIDTAMYFMDKMIKVLATGLEVIAPGLKAFITAIAEPIGNFINNILPGIAMILDSVGGIIAKIGGAISDIVTSVGNAIVNVLDGIVDAITKLSSIDGFALAQTALGITAIGGSLAAFGVGGLFGGISAGIGKLFGGDPVKKFNAFADMGTGLMVTANAIELLSRGLKSFSSVKIDTDNLEKISDALSNFGGIGTAYTLSVMGTAVDKLAKSFNSLANSITSLNGSLATFSKIQMNSLKMISGSITLLATIDKDSLQSVIDMTASDDGLKVVMDMIVGALNKNEDLSSEVSEKEAKAAAITQAKAPAKDYTETINNIVTKLSAIEKQLVNISGSAKNISSYVNEKRIGNKTIKH